VFLSHRSIYLLLFDLCQELSAATTKPYQPMTSSASHGVSWRITYMYQENALTVDSYRVLYASWHDWQTVPVAYWAKPLLITHSACWANGLRALAGLGSTQKGLEGVFQIDEASYEIKFSGICRGFTCVLYKLWQVIILRNKGVLSRHWLLDREAAHLIEVIVAPTALAPGWVCGCLSGVGRISLAASETYGRAGYYK